MSHLDRVFLIELILPFALFYIRRVILLSVVNIVFITVILHIVRKSLVTKADPLLFFYLCKGKAIVLVTTAHALMHYGQFLTLI